MRKLHLILLPVLFILVACSKDKTADIITPPEVIDTSSANIKYQGMFTPTSGIVAHGYARIISSNQKLNLVLDSFYVSGGPDLKVYLSKSASPQDFINLGALRTQTTDLTYPLMENIDFTVYTHVLIHCQQYNHLFAVARLLP